MELKDLVGVHVLDAVDRENEYVRIYGDSFELCDVIRFRLDGVVYMAVEDPSDGYRSSMRSIESGDWPMTNEFTPVLVFGRHEVKGRNGNENDVLELLDAATGKVVLSVGTECIDDYYPRFVCFFNPTAMVTNAGLCDPCLNKIMRTVK